MSSHNFALFDTIDTPVFVLEISADKQPVYVAYNQKAQENSGLSLQDVLGKTALEVFDGRRGLAAYERHMQVVESGKGCEYVVPLPVNSEHIHVSGRLTPLYDSDGDFTHIVGTTMRSHASIERLEQQVAHNAEMEHFISLAAHDLRSPVRNVKQIVSLLRESLSESNPDAVKMLDLLDQVSVNALRVVDDVIHHAQAIESVETVETFALGDLSTEVLAVLDPAAQVSIEVQPCELTADKLALQVILRNVVDNALKHNELANLKIEVQACQLDPQHIELTISDNGRGIEKPESLFNDQRKLKYQGGFGLLGIKRLVQSRGGKINAEHAPSGQGLLVRFSLPGSLIPAAH